MNLMGLGLLVYAKDAASGVLRGVQRSFGATRDQLRQFGTESRNAFASFQFGAGLMVAGLAGLRVLSPTIEAAKAFSTRISEISTLTNEATFPTDKLRSLTLDLAATYGRSPIEQAKGLYEAISSGATTSAKATALMHAANKLAIGGQTNIKTAVDGLTTSLNAFAAQGLTASDAADTMTLAVNVGKTTFPEIAKYIGQAAATASASGLSFVELNSAMAATTLGGINTRRSFTGLRQAISNIIKPNKAATEEAKRLGISFDAAALRSQGFEKLLDSITGSAKYNKDSMTKLFGSIDGLNTILALTNNNSAAFKDTLRMMRERSGAADNAFAKMSRGLGFAEDKFKALVEVSKILIGDALVPIAQRVLNFGSAVMQVFNRIPEPVRNAAVSLLAGASAALVLVGAVIALKSALAIAGTAASVFGGRAGARLVVSLAPAALTIAALTAAFFVFKSAIDRNVGGLGDRFRGAWEDIKLGMEALSQLFSQGGFSGRVRDEFLRGEKPVLTFAIKVYTLAGRIKNYLAGIGEGFTSVIDKGKPTFDALRVAMHELGAAFDTGTRNVKTTGAAFDKFGGSGKGVGRTLGEVALGLVKALTAGVEFVTWVKKGVDSVGGLSTVLGALKLVLVAVGSVMIARTVISMATLAASAISTGVSIGGLTFSLAALRAMSISGMAASAVAGLRAIMGASAAALGPVAALAAAIAALYLAYDQLSKLQDELGGEGGSDMWKKLKHDLGLSSDAEYESDLGIVSGGDFDTRAGRRTILAERREREAIKAGPAASYSPVAASVAPALASMPGAAPGIDQASVNAAASSAATEAVRAIPAPGLPPIVMQVDGEVLGRISAKGQQSSAADAFAPVSLTE